MPAEGRISPGLRWSLVGLAVMALIIVPFVVWEEAILEASRTFLGSSSNRAILAVVIVGLLSSDVLLPIPSSFVSAFAVGALGPVLGASAVWLGMTVGAFGGYALGRVGGRPLVVRLVGSDELGRAEVLFRRFGNVVLVLGRGVPVLAEATVLFAGAVRLPLVDFAWVTAAAHLGLALAYALLASLGPDGLSAALLPFVLGILVPALAMALLSRVERGRRRG